MIKAIAFRDMTHNGEPLSAVMGVKVHYNDDGLFADPIVEQIAPGRYNIIEGRETVDHLLELKYGGCRCEVR